MGMIINQIDFTKVCLSKKDNGDYIIDLDWILNGGYSSDYQGSYTLYLYENAQEKDHIDITDTENSCHSSVTFSGLDIEKTYHITLKVPSSAGGASTARLKLIIDYILEQSGSISADGFAVHWKTATGKFPVIMCEIAYVNGVNNQYYAASKAERFQLQRDIFSEEDIMDVTLALTDKSIVTGPRSKAMHFCAKPLTILTAELSFKDDNSVLNLYLLSKESSLENIRLYCIKNGYIMAIFEQTAKKSQEDHTFQAEFLIPSDRLSYDTLSMCTLQAAALWDKAESKVFDESGMIAPGAPILRMHGFEGKKLRLSIDGNHLPYPPIGYERADGSLIGSTDFSVDFDKSFSMQVRARYDRDGIQRKGSKSNKVTSFFAGYYPQKDADEKEYLQFFQNTFSEQTVSMRILEPLFADVSADIDINEGILHLKSENNDFLLTVDVTAPLTIENYTNFISKIKDGIRPYGFYLLCDALLRLVPQKQEDTGYFQCAFSPRQGMADVRPGMILDLTTAMYQPQYDPKIASCAGYSAMFRSSYPVTMQKDGAFLEFDHYAGAIAEHMNMTSFGSQNSNVILASGILDLLQPAARQPYYRIVYPEKLTHDYHTETPYPSDNIVMLAADSYGAVLEASDAICTARANINSLNIPIIIFKGRSSLSLQVPVIFNDGQRYLVPAGSTVRDVLQGHGIYSSRDFQLFRRGHDGKEYPVFVQFAEYPENIILISGDRIVCKN